MKDTYSVKELLGGVAKIGDCVVAKGSVRSRRDSKAGVSFIALNDGSCFDSVQVVAAEQLGNYANEILKLTKDCAIIVHGELVASMGGGQAVEISAKNVEVTGFVENPDTYPVSPKRHTVEYLREHAHLRVRTNLIAATMRVRNTISMAIHLYMQENGFVWVHTPIITGTDAEGAGEMFRVTNLDMKNPPKNEKGNIDYSQDFFGKETFLTVSGQLNGEAYACALSKIYTFGPTFRAENSNTTRHLAEFWMVEPEVAFMDIFGNADLAEDMLKYVINRVLINNADDMKFFAEFINKDVITRLDDIVNTNFERITYTDAIEALLKTDKKFENPVFWGIDLASEHERWLCEEHFAKPTIVYNYPRDIKAFYMRLNDDGRTVAAMDILAPGVGEIIGGSQREERYDVLLERMRDANVPREHLEWYLDLRRFGSVPHSGFGLGLERLVSYVTGVHNVRDIIPFPRTPNNANY